LARAEWNYLLYKCATQQKLNTVTFTGIIKINAAVCGAVFGLYQQLPIQKFRTSMNLYTKADMVYQDYDWTTATDAAKLNSEPDRNLFTSTEGNEVLYMINHLMQETGSSSVEDGQLIEKLIHDRLPLGKQSQVTAKRWLQEKLELMASEKS
jgi:hypothetical protein